MDGRTYGSIETRSTNTRCWIPAEQQVVCDVAIARMHASTSRELPDQTYSVPDHVRPKAGYDAMYGMDGMIVVVPSVARVLPRWLFFHTQQK